MSPHSNHCPTCSCEWNIDDDEFTCDPLDYTAVWDDMDGGLILTWKCGVSCRLVDHTHARVFAEVAIRAHRFAHDRASE